jgi:hypothetical protein
MQDDGLDLHQTRRASPAYHCAELAGERRNNMAGSNQAQVSAELRETIDGLLSVQSAGAAPTLHDVRLALQGNHSIWSQDGELLHPQDRTALLIELDQLIDAHGHEAPAAGFLPAGQRPAGNR